MKSILAAAASALVLSLPASMASATTSYQSTNSYENYRIYVVYVTFGRTRYHNYRFHKRGKYSVDRDAVIDALEARQREAKADARAIKHALNGDEVTEQQKVILRRALRSTRARIRNVRSYVRFAYKFPERRLVQLVQYLDLPVSITKRTHKRHHRHYGGFRGRYI